MAPLHRWPPYLSLKSKWLPRYRNQRFQMPCKALFSGKSPWLTLRLGKCLITVRIHCLLSLNLAFFYELCDFPQIVWSDAIWGQLCEIAPLHNIRWPDNVMPFNLSHTYNSDELFLMIIAVPLYFLLASLIFCDT